MFAGHSMLCPTTARQTPHDEKCVLCGYQGKNGAGGTPGATREMRRMAHAEPSICGGHDVSCPYDGKNSFWNFTFRMRRLLLFLRVLPWRRLFCPSFL